jgi:hypothetical protein
LKATAVQASIEPLYHGSPHDFDRFDLSKVGTGEGAQAYGHGLYFTSDKEAALGYRERLAGRPETKSVRIGDKVFTDDLTRSQATTSPEFGAEAVLRFDGDVDHAIKWLREGGSAQDKAAARWLRDNRNNIGTIDAPGRLYEVSVAANPEDFLDWDRGGAARYLELSGGRYSDPATSAALRAEGIPGIRYFEPARRTNDYVVFDDRLVDIRKRY